MAPKGGMSSPAEVGGPNETATAEGMHEWGDTGLSQAAINRLLAAGHDLKVLTESEQVGYLRWLYRKFDFDIRHRYIILVDGRAGRGEWRREAFLTKPAIDVLRQRYGIRLADVGCQDVRDGVVHTVRASTPGHRATEVQGFAPRCLPDGSVDAFAYAKARAAARRTAVRELAAVPLAAFDDLDHSRTRVVDTDLGSDEPENMPAAGLDGRSSSAPGSASAQEELLRGHAPLLHQTGGERGDTKAALQSPRSDSAFSVQEPRLSNRERRGALTDSDDRSNPTGGPGPPARSARLFQDVDRQPGAIPDVARARPWDPRSEFAESPALRILRALAMRKLRTVHDEETYRHWLGTQTQKPFAERDPADLSAADVEALHRQLAPLPDLPGREAIGVMNGELDADDTRSLERAAVADAAMALAEPTPTASAELER